MPLSGTLLAVPFLLIASYVFFLGLAVQVTFAFQILIAVAYTLYILVPCVIDRLLHERIGNRLLATLVYPAALVFVQFLLSYIDELGTVLTWTGGMFSQKPLIQIVSLTGVWGPSFLVGWLASIANALWEEKLDLRKLKAPVLAFVGPGDEPSRENAVVHTELSMFRGIENGVSMLRTTLEGLTLGMDYQGRVLSQMNYYLTRENRIVLTELPTKGTRTLYAAWGDWFAWLCTGLLVFLAVWGIIGARGRSARERR